MVILMYQFLLRRGGAHLRRCSGQHADLTRPERTLEQCWHISEAKSGVFFALACRAGARLATPSEKPLQAFGEFGLHLGLLIQIKNDAGGLAASPGHRSDLEAAIHATLPIAYALHVLAAPHPTMPARPQRRADESSRAALFCTWRSQRSSTGNRPRLRCAGRRRPLAHGLNWFFRRFGANSAGGGL